MIFTTGIKFPCMRLLFSALSRYMKFLKFIKFHSFSIVLLSVLLLFQSIHVLYHLTLIEISNLFKFLKITLFLFSYFVNGFVFSFTKVASFTVKFHFFMHLQALCFFTGLSNFVFCCFDILVFCFGLSFFLFLSLYIFISFYRRCL